jgi:hypothetical protein
MIFLAPAKNPSGRTIGGSTLPAKDRVERRQSLRLECFGRRLRSADSP